MKQTLLFIYASILIGMGSCRNINNENNQPVIETIKTTDNRGIFIASMVDQSGRVGYANAGSILEVIEHRDMQGQDWVKVRGFTPQPFTGKDIFGDEYEDAILKEGWMVNLYTVKVE